MSAEVGVGIRSTTTVGSDSKPLMNNHFTMPETVGSSSAESCCDGRNANSGHSGNGNEDDEEMNAWDHAYETLISNFKALYDTMRAEESEHFVRLEEGPQMGLVEHIFDLSLERYLNGERAGGFQELVRDGVMWYKDGKFVFRAFRYKRTSIDSFDQYVRWNSDTEEVIIQSKMYFYRDTAKVIKVETRRFERRKKLPGQVSSIADRKIWNGFMERDFSKTVHALPCEVQGQLLLGGNETPKSLMGVPVMEKYEMIRIYMEIDSSGVTASGQTFKSKDMHRLYDERKAPLEDGAYWKFKKNTSLFGGSSHKMVLFNSTDDPMCMCSREKVSGEYLYIIYGRNEIENSGAPRLEEKIDKQSITFHAWFQFRVSKAGNLQVVFVWHSHLQHFEPYMKLTQPTAPVEKRELHHVSTKGKVSHPVALACYEDESKIYAVISKQSNSLPGEQLAEILIAPGVDPGMVLCMAACVGQIDF